MHTKKVADDDEFLNVGVGFSFFFLPLYCKTLCSNKNPCVAVKKLSRLNMNIALSFCSVVRREAKAASPSLQLHILSLVLRKVRHGALGRRVAPALLLLL